MLVCAGEHPAAPGEACSHGHPAWPADVAASELAPCRLVGMASGVASDIGGRETVPCVRRDREIRWKPRDTRTRQPDSGTSPQRGGLAGLYRANRA